jgi:hypothetical protein
MADTVSGNSPLVPFTSKISPADVSREFIGSQGTAEEQRKPKRGLDWWDWVGFTESARKTQLTTIL